MTSSRYRRISLCRRRATADSAGLHSTTFCARDIRHLVFVGIATNVCVESTIRDAYHREFICILVADATQQSGPAFIQDATLYNVERFLGWVTTTDAVCGALATAQTSA